MNALIDALKELGISCETVRVIAPENRNVWIVVVNDEYFGLWDYTRNTFID
jgi:hypothetical protein